MHSGSVLSLISYGPNSTKSLYFLKVNIVYWIILNFVRTKVTGNAPFTPCILENVYELVSTFV
jgi:hypothetical protein